MKRIVVFAAAASVAAFSALAQDLDDDLGLGDDGAGEAAVEPASSGDDGDDGAAVDRPSVKTIKDDRVFTTLPFCRKLEGRAEILKPGSSTWEELTEGKFYPLGSSYRTLEPGSKLKIQFGGDDTAVEIEGVASFGTRIQAIGERSRAIILQSGVISVKLPRNLPEGMFKVVAPGFTINDPAGESRYAYFRTEDGDVAQVRCVTGNLSIEGRHFKFPMLKAANEVKIRSSKDHLFTGLYGKSGDCVVELDQGVRAVQDFATGETSIESKPLEWKLSPKTAVRIHRLMPAIGTRMSVTVMTFDASGELHNRCAFTEGRPEVNTGELGPIANAGRDELAKKAAEAAETISADVDIDDAEEGGEEAPADDSGDSGAGEAPADDDFEF